MEYNKEQMASQVFYRKWRPQRLSEVVGQEHVTTTLRHAIASGRIAHAYLFCGPRGTGKTSTGRILAKAINCLNPEDGEPCNRCTICTAINQNTLPDVIEIDAASNRGIDDIRSLREKVNYAPSMAKYKVYIIDEVHMISKDASNAFLKTLEEPPEHVKFVLATTEPHKVLSTITSRCQRFDFHRLSSSALSDKLEFICKKEGVEIEPEALTLIARSAAGSLRDAENLLEQLTVYYGRRIEVEHVRELLGICGDPRVKEVAKHIIDRDVTAGLRAINSVASDGIDLRQFARELLDYLRQLLLVRSGADEAIDATSDDLAEMKTLAARTSLEYLASAVKRFSEIDLRLDNYSPLPLELALVDCSLLTAPTATPGATAKAAEDKQPAPVPSYRATEAQATPQPATPQVHHSSPPPEMKPSPELDQIRGRWKEFIQALRGEGSSGNLDAFLRSACEPIAVENDTLVLGFYYELHKAKIEDPKYKHLVEKKLKEVFGQAYKLRCVLTPKTARAFSRKEANIPLVRAALERGAIFADEEPEAGGK